MTSIFASQWAHRLRIIIVLFLVLILGCICSIVYFGVYTGVLRRYSNSFGLGHLRSSLAGDSKTILLWTLPFDDISMVQEFAFVNPFPIVMNEMYIRSPRCGRCLITVNRSLLWKSEAVVFHGPGVDDPIPHKRFEGQVYVLWSEESPLSYPLIHILNDIYDLTMTVNPNSDVYSPYASFSWILKLLGTKNIYFFQQVRAMKGIFGEMTPPARIKLTTSDLVKSKNRKALWIASNCHTEGAKLRMNIVDALEWLGFEVDKFGDCFDRRFPAPSRWLNSHYEYISKYKFYLSFENSYHCKGYITEKLWYNALYSGAVPVIWGPHRDDVAKVLPPKSYIHVEDYKSLQELVTYLNYLDNHDDEYAEYLKWRSWTKYLDNNGEYSPSQTSLPYSSRPSTEVKKLLDTYADPEPIGFCGLCKKLHSGDFINHTNTVPLEMTERSECLDLDEAWNATLTLLPSGYSAKLDLYDFEPYA